MKKITDKAFVISVHQDVSPEVLRINLRWRGDHEISDFDLAGLGKVLHAEAETENAGWVVIEHPPLCETRRRSSFARKDRMIPQNPELVTAKSLSVEVAEPDRQTAQHHALSWNQDP